MLLVNYSQVDYEIELDKFFSNEHGYYFKP
jgi:hypothetical protein